MPNIVDSVMNTMAAASYGKSNTPYAARNHATTVRNNLAKSKAAYDESKRLDRKWNNGYDSADTIAAGNRLKSTQRQKDVLDLYLKDQMSSLSTSPASKEYADRTWRMLNRR